MRFCNIATAALFIVTTLLTACLGGGSSNTPATTSTTASSTTFPLLQAINTLTVGGINKTFTLTDIGSNLSCSGTGSLINSPASTSTTFNSTPTNTVSALSSVNTYIWNWSNCTPTYNVQTSTSYYNPSNYLPLGDSSIGVNYGVWATAPTYPSSITINSTGIIGTENLYTDNTEVTSSGRIDESYTVTADTASTAIVTLISKNYNASSVLQSAKLDAWRITTAGTLTPLTNTIQYATGNVIVFTFSGDGLSSTATISSYVNSAYSLDKINLASDLQALVSTLGSQGYLCSGNEIASVASLKETHVQSYLNSLIAYVQLVKTNSTIDKTAIAALINMYQSEDLAWLASSSTAYAMGNCGFSAAQISSTTFSSLIPLYYSNAIALLSAM